MIKRVPEYGSYREPDVLRTGMEVLREWVCEIQGRKVYQVF
jgi:hypothetical protein